MGSHPLIAWSIKVALDSDKVDRCIVSTDDREIAAVAKKYGAEVPFLRPSQYAQDETPDRPVFLHALDWLLEKERYEPDFVLHLRPTSPFRSKSNISDILNIWAESNCDAVRSVSEIDAISHPYWAYAERKGYGNTFLDDAELVKKYPVRQTLPPAYKAHGLIDGYSTKAIRTSEDMLGENFKLYITNAALDIDHISDLEYAEYLFEKGQLASPFIPCQ